MAESFEQYRARLLEYLGSRDPIRVQQVTPARLERLLAGVPQRVLRLRPAPAKWSIIEIVAPMADAELAMAWRLRNMLAGRGVPLQWFDQDVWAERLGYASSDPWRSVALFRSLRQSNLALLRSVPRSSWGSCYGVHEVRGRQTVAEFVRLEAAHDLNHLRQIQEILRRGERQAPPRRVVGPWRRKWT
jgi:hypothetical protein